MSNPNKRSEYASKYKTWNDLTLDEKKSWLEAYPKMKSRPAESWASAYDNAKYIERFGIDAFKANTDKRARDAEYKKQLLEDVRTEIFGNEFDVNGDIQSKIASLSPEGVEELLNSDYVTKEEGEAKNAQYDEEIAKEKSSSKDRVMRAFINAAESISGTNKINKDATKTLSEQDKESWNEGTFGKGNTPGSGYGGRNKEILESIYANDVARGEEKSAPMINTMERRFNSMDSAELDEAFHSFFDRYTITNDFGDEYEHSGIGLYQEYKDSKYLADLSDGDKAYLLAKYYGMVAAGQNPVYAEQAVTNALQNYIADRETNLDWWLGVGRGIGAKSYASLGQLYVGMEALGLAIKDATDNGNRLENYLQGKDENGEELDAAHNINYWNGVDQYSAFKFDRIKEIEENGGFSRFNRLGRVGGEKDFSAIMYEAGKMAGYTAEQALISYLTGGVLGKVIGSTGQMATWLPKFAQFNQAMTIPLSISALNAIPISVGYAKGSFDTVLQEANNTIDRYLQADAAEFVKNGIDNLEYKDGKFVAKDLSEDQANEQDKLNASLWVTQLNDYLDKKTEEAIQAYLNTDEAKKNKVTRDQLDVDAFRQQLASEASAEFADHLNRDYIENHEADYSEARQMAKDASVKAYVWNATTEFIRMLAFNYYVKQWLFSKDIQRAMAANNPHLDIIDANGKLAATGKLLGQQISKKAALWIGPAKNFIGGGWSNYVDDIDSAFSQALAKNEFNKYVELGFDAEKARASASFFDDLYAGIAAAEEMSASEQAYRDFIIGAVGSITSVLPNLKGSLSNIFNALSGRNALNHYDNAAIDREAQKLGITRKEYIDGDFTRAAKLQKPNASEAELTQLANSIKKSSGLAAKIADGTIRRRSAAEIANDFITNGLLNEYANAIERERDFENMLNERNAQIDENRTAIEDILRHVTMSNRREATEVSQRQIDVEDMVAAQAFDIAVTLDEWSRDPAMSRSSIVQDYLETLQRYAKGNFTEQDIQSFLEHVDNADIKSQPNASDIARETLQKNAQRMLNFQKSYSEISEQIKNSSEYRKVRDSVSANQVAKQLAFYKVMIPQREERQGQMHNEVFGTPTLGTFESDIAKYGTQIGKDNMLAAKQKQLEGLRKDYKETEEKLAKEKNSKRKDNPLKKLRVKAFEASLRAKERAVYEAEDEIAKMKGTKSDFSEVLDVEGILALAPEDMATMLNPKNLHMYTKEQQTAIKEAVREVKRRDPDALQKIADIAELEERNKDAKRAYDLMSEDLVSARDYFEYAQSKRAFEVEEAATYNAFDTLADTIDEADGDAVKFSLVKRFPYAEALERYKKQKGYADDASTPEYVKNAEKVIKTREDAERLIRNQFGSDPNVARALMKELRERSYDTDVMNDSDIIDIVESFADRNPEGAGKEAFNSIVESLQRLGYTRDATKSENRRRVAEEEARKAAKLAQKDGKNFGWDGYVVGDAIYRKSDGSDGTVLGFFKQGDKNMMQVQWTKGGITGLSSELKDNYSKTKPEIKKPTSAEKAEPDKPKEEIKPEEAKSPAEAPKAPEGFEVKSAQDIELTDDGAPIIPSEQAQAEAAAIQADTYVMVPSEQKSSDVANPKEVSAGLLVGNAMYQYDTVELENLGKVVIRKGEDPNDSMSAFFNWISDKGIQLQKIIDRELNKIVEQNPDTKIQFMRVNTPGMQNHVLEVVEFTPEVEKIHDDSLGGVITVDGKRYLLVGTLGWARNSSNAGFFAIANPLRRMAGEREMYVLPAEVAHTKVAKIDAGRLVKQQVNEDAATFRKLSELFNDAERNPNKINFANAVFGIMYNDKNFVLSNNTNNARMYPPGRSESTIGRVFLMIPAANGNYIPVALKRDIYLNDLADGDYKNAILSILDDLTSANLEVRQKAIRELPAYLLLGDNNTILVGNSKYNNISVKKDGAIIFSQEVNDKFNRQAFLDAVNSALRINITMDALKNEATLGLLDAAGALVTDVSSLEAVNASYSVYEVDLQGKPIEIEVNTPAPIQHDSAPVTTTTSVDGALYRKRGNKFYDQFNTEITSDNPLYASVYYGIMVQEYGIPVSFTNKKGEDYYIISDSRENPLVIKRDKSGHVTIPSVAKSREMLTRIAKETAERERKEAVKAEAERLNALEKERLKTSNEDILGLEGQPEQAPQQPQEAPQAPEVTPEQDTKKIEEAPKQDIDVNKATRNSLADLEAERKKVTFENIMRFDKPRAKEIKQIAKEKGWNLGANVKDAEAFLKTKLAPGTLESITNVDSFIDMLRNCK